MREGEREGRREEGRGTVKYIGIPHNILLTQGKKLAHKEIHACPQLLHGNSIFVSMLDIINDVIYPALNQTAIMFGNQKSHM